MAPSFGFRKARLQLRFDECFQFAAQFRGHFVLATAVAARGPDGLTVRANKLAAPRTVGEMLLEAPLHFGIEAPLRVGEEEAMNVAAAKPPTEKLPDAIHWNSRCL